jgi:CRISPR-associated endonuclease/helicase Cas3
MLHLLKVLLEHHARSGGSAVLLSATIPLGIREELLTAFARGRGVEHSPDASDDRRYPLAIQMGTATRVHSCPTREPLRRSVRVVMLHDEGEALRLLADEVAKGRCVGWIRNTVEDGRRGFRDLASRLPASSVTLFHSRFALGDRLAIEQGVVDRFGKDSTAAGRRGRVLVGTQVLEQSLDYDVDLMVSDWAPIDLIIQRAGRLMRHVRAVNGDVAEDGRDGRGEPVLYVLVPPLVDPPESNWYSALFPKGQYVYQDFGRLWLGADAQRRAGAIDTPGEVGGPASVRGLVEAVYGDAVKEIPEALEAATFRAEGAAAAEQGMGIFNALRLDTGYAAASSVRWTEDDRVPTRLGKESRTIYLALALQDGLVPLKQDLCRPWENSAVRVDAKRFHGLGAEWEARFGDAIGKLRASIPLLREPVFILPLVRGTDGVLRGAVSQLRGQELEVRYDAKAGLEW